MSLNCYIYTSKNDGSLKEKKCFRKAYSLHNAVSKVINTQKYEIDTELTYSQFEEVCYLLIDDPIFSELSDLLDELYNRKIFYVSG